MQSMVVEQDERAIQSPAKVRDIRRKGDDGKQFVEFNLGKEHFAVNLFHTREVITPSEITPLPSAPAYITGVMDLRGSITTIVDLKKLMNITTDSEGKKQSRIIILDTEVSKKPVGILVDDVTSVSTYTSADIDKNTRSQEHSNQNILGFIRGKVKDDNKEGHNLIIWLDISTMIKTITDFV